MTADPFPKAHATHTERFPLGPAERLLRGGTGALALLCGVHRRQVERWRHQGLTAAQADHLACLLHLHPSLIWGDAWWTPSPDDGADPPSSRPDGGATPPGHDLILIGAA